MDMIYIIIERKTYRTKLKSHHKESMKKCIYIEAKQKNNIAVIVALCPA